MAESFDSVASKLHNGAGRQECILWNHDDTIANVIERVVEILRCVAGRDNAVVADARVFVDDGVLDPAIAANAEPRLAFGVLARNRGERFVEIVSHYHRPPQLGPFPHNAAQAKDRLANGG